MADDFGLGYALGSDSGGGNNGGNGMFNGDAFWGIILLALLFGNNGFGGGFGGFGGGRSGGCGSPCATQADLAAGFNNSAVLGNLNDLALGQAGIQQTLCQGFGGINTAIGNLGYNIQAGFNTLGYQQKDCCCETQRLIERGFCDLGQSINMQTRDIIDNQNANYRGLMDFLVTEKLAAKDARIAALEGQLGRSEQNGLIGARIDAAVAELIRRTGHDYPSAAFLVQPPTPVNFPTNGCGQVQFGYGGNGCGCGCG